jgi:hypothetical protein
MWRASSARSSATLSAEHPRGRVGPFPAAGLLLALLAAGAEDFRIEELAAAKIGAGSVLSAARRAGLLPAYARFLERIAPRASSPETTRAVALGILAERRSAACVALLEELGAAARHAGDPVALKGAALTLAGFYARGERQMADADLLVAPEAIGAWKIAAERIGARFAPLRAGGYEVACVERGGAIVEIHVALAGEAGRMPSLSHASLSAAAIPCAAAGFRVPGPAACRQIAAHHLVFHHGGAGEHGLRALQDLARLPESTPEDAPLRWPERSPIPATRLLGRVAAALREGRWEAPECRRTLAPILRAICGGGESARDFSEEVDEIVGQGSRAGLGRLKTLFRHAFPPMDQLRRRPDEARTRTLARYPSRALALGARYAAARAVSLGRRRERRRWREFLASGGAL